MTKNLISYLSSLPASVLVKLFHHHAATIVILRSLTDIGQVIVTRLLFYNEPVPYSFISSWLRPSSALLCSLKLEIDQLKALHLVKEIPGSDEVLLVLEEVFRSSLKVALITRSVELFFNEMPERKVDKVSVSLSEYCQSRWDSVLYFMALPTNKAAQVSIRTKEVLKHADLIKLNDSLEGSVEITSKGFQFLLMARHVQIWTYLTTYLKLIQEANGNLSDCLGMLFELSLCKVGCTYSCASLSETAQEFLQHLREIGILYQKSRKTMCFQPTPPVRILARAFCSGNQEDSNDHDGSHRGFIVLETNFRLCLYTNSPLELAVVSIFCEMLYRFENLAVAVLSRESVRKALQVGVTADQIIGYLRIHAHAEMSSKNPVIPSTVSDQIRLWELELVRLTFTDGVQYSQFLSDADFTLVRNYAKDLSVLLWENAENRTMIVSSTGHDDVKRFWKRQKK